MRRPGNLACSAFAARRRGIGRDMTMLKACVIGMGPIGIYMRPCMPQATALVWSPCVTGSRSVPGRPGRGFDVPWYVQRRGDAGAARAGPMQRGHGRRRVCQRPLSSRPCRRCRPARTCCARNRSQTTWPTRSRWSRRRGSLNRCLAIDLNHRFTPAARVAKRWQDEGRLGDLLFVNMALWIGKFGPLDSPYYHLKALNPHSVDIMRYFCGDCRDACTASP